MCTKDVTVACGAKTGPKSGLGGASGMDARTNTTNTMSCNSGRMEQVRVENNQQNELQ